MHHDELVDCLYDWGIRIPFHVEHRLHVKSPCTSNDMKHGPADLTSLVLLRVQQATLSCWTANICTKGAALSTVRPRFFGHRCPVPVTFMAMINDVAI